MAIDPHALDVSTEQGGADAFYDFLALHVEHFKVAAKQHFSRQAKRPALFGQFKALLFQYCNLRRRQAFWRSGLATGQRQRGQQ